MVKNDQNDDFFVLALDLSLSCSGVCIFDKNGSPIEVFSIPTNSKHETGQRLKTIADALFDVKNRYNFGVIVFEKGFSRFPVSTQMIFRVTGVANYVFYDKEQVYFAPSTIKKIVSGNGKSDKLKVRSIVEKKYPTLVLKNEDESDAVSIGMAYFVSMEGDNAEKNSKK
jgi:Holliday junction resolvasome RuvABC endonuclease subunit